MKLVYKGPIATGHMTFQSREEFEAYLDAVAKMVIDQQVRYAADLPDNEARREYFDELISAAALIKYDEERYRSGQFLKKLKRLVMDELRRREAAAA